ncbi:MAG TPA: methyltransferase [Acidimicrobiales bacterium]|nr:methyltransferase [Acidimicrobiales bacterium]
MSDRYVYDHAWVDERIRLAGLEAALDPGTREHFLRLRLAPGNRCLEVGGGGGSVARWLAGKVLPRGSVLATDLETDFLESEAGRRPGLEVLRHDVTTEDLPGDFDFVHARWLVEWLPDKRQALRRMVNALKPGGSLLVEEPDFVSILGTAEPPALRRTITAAMVFLESTCPVEVTYGRRLFDDLAAAGLSDVAAEGRSPIVRGGSPPAADFLRLTIEKFRVPLLDQGKVSEQEFAEATEALQDPRRSFVMPMTVAAWGQRRI